MKSRRQVRRNACTRLHEKICVYLSPQTHRITLMEAERINAIGNQLTSLTERTLELRGYL